MIGIVIFDSFNPDKRAYIAQLSHADQYQEPGMWQPDTGEVWRPVRDRDQWQHGKPVLAMRQPPGDTYRVDDRMDIESLEDGTHHTVTIDAIQMANVSELTPDEIDALCIDFAYELQEGWLEDTERCWLIWVTYAP